MFKLASIEGEVNFNQIDEAGRFPPMTAAVCGNISMVRFFIEKGADVNQATADATTAFSIALAIGGKKCYRIPN